VLSVGLSGESWGTYTNRGSQGVKSAKIAGKNRFHEKFGKYGGGGGWETIIVYTLVGAREGVGHFMVIIRGKDGKVGGIAKEII